MSAPDAKILAAYSEWRRLYDLTCQSMSDADYEQLITAERAVLACTPSTVQGLALQFVTFTSFGEFEATQSASFDFEKHMLALAAVEPPAALQTIKAGA